MRANNFDLIRLILAVSVIFGHSFEMAADNQDADPANLLFHTLRIGELAVCGFFILSGYLITKSWTSDPTPGRFAAHRFLRIVPAFVVAFLIAVLIVGPLGAKDPAAYTAALSPTLLLDLVSLHPPVTPPVFPGHGWPMVNGAVWTIQWEAICYIMTPLIVALATRGRSLLWYGAILVLLVAKFPDLVGARFLLMFYTGAMFAMRGPAAFKWWPLAAIGLFGCMFVSALAGPAVAALGGYLLLAMGLAKQVTKPFPDISYGVFLYGWPAQKLAIQWGVTNPFAIFAVALAAAAALGYVSHLAIEAPALRLRPRRRALVAA